MDWSQMSGTILEDYLSFLCHVSNNQVNRKEVSIMYSLLISCSVVCSDSDSVYLVILDRLKFK